MTPCCVLQKFALCAVLHSVPFELDLFPRGLARIGSWSVGLGWMHEIVAGTGQAQKHQLQSQLLAGESVKYAAVNLIVGSSMLQRFQVPVSACGWMLYVGACRTRCVIHTMLGVCMHIGGGGG